MIRVSTGLTQYTFSFFLHLNLITDNTTWFIWIILINVYASNLIIYIMVVLLLKNVFLSITVITIVRRGGFANMR